MEAKIGDKVKIYEGMKYGTEPLNLWDKCCSITKSEVGMGTVVDIKKDIPWPNLKVRVINMSTEYIYIPMGLEILYEPKPTTPPRPKHTIQRKKYSLIGKIIY